jgi:hypothetical protein
MSLFRERHVSFVQRQKCSFQRKTIVSFFSETEMGLSEKEMSPSEKDMSPFGKRTCLLQRKTCFLQPNYKKRKKEGMV